MTDYNVVFRITSRLSGYGGPVQLKSDGVNYANFADHGSFWLGARYGRLMGLDPLQLTMTSHWSVTDTVCQAWASSALAHWGLAADWSPLWSSVQRGHRFYNGGWIPDHRPRPFESRVFRLLDMGAPASKRLTLRTGGQIAVDFWIALESA